MELLYGHNLGTLQPLNIVYELLSAITNGFRPALARSEAANRALFPALQLTTTFGFPFNSSARVTSCPNGIKIEPSITPVSLY